MLGCDIHSLASGYLASHIYIYLSNEVLVQSLHVYESKIILSPKILILDAILQWPHILFSSLP